MNENDREYCLRRAAEERDRMRTSKALDVADRHAALARLYELRATDPSAWSALSTQKTA